eukprot:scaffold17222_cov110-Isochrysis_galbana.AAC.1
MTSRSRPSSKPRTTATRSSRSCVPRSAGASMPWRVQSKSETTRARWGELTNTSAATAGSTRDSLASISTCFCGGTTTSPCCSVDGRRPPAATPPPSPPPPPTSRISSGSCISWMAVRRTVGVSAVADANTSCRRFHRDGAPPSAPALRARTSSRMRSVSSRWGGWSASSTSSMIMCRTRRSGTFFDSRVSSATRPAVPTSTCGLTCLYRSSCRFTFAPPTSARAERPVPASRAEATRAVWCASSRDGHSTSSCGSRRLGSSWLMSGRRVASVLPEPVWACTMASRPDESGACEAACSAFGLDSLPSISTTLATTASARPKSANVGPTPSAAPAPTTSSRCKSSTAADDATAHAPTAHTRREAGGGPGTVGSRRASAATHSDGSICPRLQFFLLKRCSLRKSGRFYSREEQI